MRYNNYHKQDEKEDNYNKYRKCDYCDNTSETGKIHMSKGKYLCKKHYSQIRLYGEILERTKYNGNDVEDKGDYFAIILRNRSKEVTGETLIDKEDIEVAKKYTWSLCSSHGYAVANYKNSKKALHREIMNAIDSKDIVDHINRNKLDNRRANLRVTDKSINAINTGVRKSNKSGVTGVSYSKDKKLWRAYISVNKKVINLGWFKDKDSAIETRLKSEWDNYKESSPQYDMILKYGIDKEGEKNE